MWQNSSFICMRDRAEGMVWVRGECRVLVISIFPIRLAR